MPLDAEALRCADDLEQVDREIVRLASLCEVKVLEAGVIARVLKNDASVCATANPMAFRKLRELLMLHLAMREKAAESFGQAQANAIEDHIVKRLRACFPDLPGAWPPA